MIIRAKGSELERDVASVGSREWRGEILRMLGGRK
jgi:hypothetical protein